MSEYFEKLLEMEFTKLTQQHQEFKHAFNAILKSWRFGLPKLKLEEVKPKLLELIVEWEKFGIKVKFYNNPFLQTVIGRKIVDPMTKEVSGEEIYNTKNPDVDLYKTFRKQNQKFPPYPSKSPSLVIIVIEGNIAAGKSTLIRKLKNILKGNVKCFEEPHEDKNPYLSLFYEDQQKYILPLQHWFMSDRLYKYSKLVRECNNNNNQNEPLVAILDRCIFSDVVFVRNAFNNGVMSKVEYDNFMETREDLLSAMPFPNIIINLKVDASICYNRIHESRKSKCEQTIPLSYLENIEKCYDIYLSEMRENGVEIIEYDWSNFGNRINFCPDSGLELVPKYNYSDLRNAETTQSQFSQLLLMLKKNFPHIVPTLY